MSYIECYVHYLNWNHNAKWLWYIYYLRAIKHHLVQIDPRNCVVCFDERCLLFNDAFMNTSDAVLNYQNKILAIWYYSVPLCFLHSPFIRIPIMKIGIFLSGWYHLFWSLLQETKAYFRWMGIGAIWYHIASIRSFLFQEIEHKISHCACD